MGIGNIRWPGRVENNVPPEDAPGASSALLSVSKLSISFGGLLALSNISFDVNESEICGLIGPNGAGKTTLFNCLSRLYKPSAGTITFSGASILDLPRHRVVGLGLGRTFQNLSLLGSMSVFENVMLGGYCRTTAGFLASFVKSPGERREERALAERVQEVLSYLELSSYADRKVLDLPFGIQKRVEFARALVSQPKLLLLDEPAAGLNHEEIQWLKSLILDVRTRFDLAVLLVEHHMNLVMSVSDKIVALNFGMKIYDGTPNDSRANSALIEAYLGTSNDQ